MDLLDFWSFWQGWAAGWAYLILHLHWSRKWLCAKFVSAHIIIIPGKHFAVRLCSAWRVTSLTCVISKALTFPSSTKISLNMLEIIGIRKTRSRSILSSVHCLAFCLCPWLCIKTLSLTLSYCNKTVLFCSVMYDLHFLVALHCDDIGLCYPLHLSHSVISCNFSFCFFKTHGACTYQRLCD